MVFPLLEINSPSDLSLPIATYNSPSTCQLRYHIPNETVSIISDFHDIRVPWNYLLSETLQYHLFTDSSNSPINVFPTLDWDVRKHIIFLSLSMWPFGYPACCLVPIGYSITLKLKWTWLRRLYYFLQILKLNWGWQLKAEVKRQHTHSSFPLSFHTLLLQLYLTNVVWHGIKIRSISWCKNC